jgi:hypothetical protein
LFNRKAKPTDKKTKQKQFLGGEDYDKPLKFTFVDNWDEEGNSQSAEGSQGQGEKVEVITLNLERCGEFEASSDSKANDIAHNDEENGDDIDDDED